MNKNYKKTIDDKDTIGYAGNEAGNGYGKNRKIKLIVVSGLVLLITVLVVVGFIRCAPKTIKDTGLYFNEKGESATITLDVKYHKGLKDYYYTGEVIVDGTVYKSVYDLYNTKTSMFVVENDYALTAFKNSLALSDFSYEEKTVRIINIMRNGESEAYIGPAESYEELMSLFIQ